MDFENATRRGGVRVEQHGGLGLIWFAGWLFTIGYLHHGFWQGLLGRFVWPYFLGAHDTGEETEAPPASDGKDAAAVSMGKRGGAARAKKLSPEKRAQIAKKAAKIHRAAAQVLADVRAAQKQGRLPLCHWPRSLTGS